MSKAEATRLADALVGSFPAFGDGTRSDRERLALEAAALLRQWPDGEPVAWMVVNADGALSLFDNEEEAERYAEWAHGPRPVHPLYTAPPAARIAELEAALKVAGEALRHGIKTINHLGGAVECMPLHDAIQQIKEAQR